MGIQERGVEANPRISEEKDHFLSVFWISQVLFWASGKDKRQKKGENGRKSRISRTESKTLLKLPLVSLPFAAAKLDLWCKILKHYKNGL